MKRREFLKVAGATTAAGTAFTGLNTNWFGLDHDPIPDPQTDGKVVPTFCELCFWKCGIHAHVKDGTVTKIEGSPDHPLSRGRLCPRGTGGLGLLYDPDRLKKPLMRKEIDGKQEFVEVEWDEALDFIAEKLQAVAATHGPESLAFFSHGMGGAWWKKLFKAYGTPNMAAPSWAQCRGPRDKAFDLVFGSYLASPEPIDMANSRCITLIGAHLGENMHNTQVQDFAEAVGRGADVIVVDPRYSVAAGKARHWLPIKPGTDTALLLAWIHVLLEEGLYDRSYVEKYATGLDELRAHVADKTPEWAFTETGIEPALIRASARTMAAARPASLIHPGRHVTWYGNDVDRMRAVAMLNALLGSWGRRGGYYLKSKMSLAKDPLAGKVGRKARRPVADRAKDAVYPFGDETLAHGLRDATIPGHATYDIKAWVVYGTNLIQCLPERKKTEEAVQHLDLVVAIDVLPAEITGWADVILPECTYLERHDDLWSAGYSEPFVALRQPVVQPMYDSKPGWWMVKEIAERMDLGALFPWKDPRTYLRARADASNLSFDELEAKGVVRGTAEPATTEDGIELTFGTPSGKIELYSKQMEDAGLDPMPVYQPPTDAPEGYYRLLFGRAPVHTFGRTTNNRMLGEIMAENAIWVNTRTARELGLSKRSRVIVENQDGAKAGPVRVKITERIRPDTVYMVHGFGHDNPKLRFANGKGASDSDLVTQVAIDPVIGSTGMSVNFVTLEEVAS